LETIGKEITDMLGLDDGRFFSVYDEASGRTHLLGSFFFANKLTFSSSGSTALPHPDRGVSTGYAIVQGLNCDLPLLGFCLDVDKWNSMPSRQKKMDVS
jgi:hypothetical protein